jgi:hypothetical protein
MTSAFAKIKDIKIRGYVTNIISPTVFEIEDYRITRDEAFKLEFDNASPELTFKIEDIRIGTELEIRGLYNDETGELQAKTIKVDMEQFKKIKETVILSHTPEGIEKSGSGWTGVLSAGGQRVRISPDKTQVVFKLTSREQKVVKEQNKQKEKQAKTGALAPNDAAEYRPVSSLDEVTAGMAMTYEGVRNKEDGSIDAEKVEFAKNDFEKGEESLWKRLKTSVKPGDASKLKPGELSIAQVGKFKLLPDDEVQEYVRKLGNSLIPKYLVAPPDGTPGTPRFQFYVVIQKDANAFALANGTIVIHSGLFNVLENQAQLASIIGHEISHSVQEHTWRQMQYHRNKLALLSIGAAFAAAYGYREVADIANLIEAAIRTGYSRSLENQADRLGLEYMVQSGYDPREAPRVWKQMTKAYGLQVTNFFWSTHENQATRRSYLMNELKNNYADLDYSKTRTGEEEFKQIVGRVRASVDKKKTIKVKD